MPNDHQKEIEVLATKLLGDEVVKRCHSFETVCTGQVCGLWAVGHCTRYRYCVAATRKPFNPFENPADCEMVEAAVVDKSTGGVRFSWKYTQTYENGYRWSAGIWVGDLLWASVCQQETRIVAGCLAALVFVKKLPECKEK